MRNSLIALMLTLLLALVVGGCMTPQSVLEKRGPTAARVAFVDVNVIPMDTERVLPHQTVVVHHGVIESITPYGSATLPPGTVQLETQGQYLIPALADMHVHLGDDRDLALYVAHGVGTIRAVGEVAWWARAMGFPSALVLRDEVKSGAMVGPRIFTSGLILEGEPLTSPMMEKVLTPDEARRAVRKQKGVGVDFIKVYDRLSEPVFRAILDEAHKQGLDVVGHAPTSVAPWDFLRSGVRSAEHLTDFFDNDRVQLRVAEGDLGATARLAHEQDVWHTPTLVIFDGMMPPPQYRPWIHSLPGFSYVTWRNHFWWRMTVKAVFENAAASGVPPLEYAQRCEKEMQRIVRVLRDEKVPLLAGTDANFVGVVPGFSLHRELALLVEAGLSPFEALQTATVNPAKFLHEDKGGVVQPGAPARLLLLHENPLASIQATRSIAGVMLEERWYPRALLDAALAQY